MREFNTQELKAHLETCDQQPLLLDVRQPWEFEVCKIENSVLLPMSQITAEYNNLDFDREAGVLRISQRTLFVKNKSVVPLFHLRAVVIVARPQNGAANFPTTSRFVAYIERRVGDAIYLDEGRRCARLLAIAEAIAEVAELRLEYDAMSHAAD